MNAVDTNVLVYACDLRDPAKQNRAIELIGDLPDGVILWQVACEFIAAARRLELQGFSAEAAWRQLERVFRILPLVLPNPSVLVGARAMHLSGNIAFWDAMIYAAC